MTLSTPLPPPGRDAEAPAPRVMLLSLWVAAGAVWHARLIDSDARVHEFDSPFELARFLAHAGAVPGREVVGGLR